MEESELRERIDACSRFPHRGKITIVTDTTEFMNIQSGDVLELEGEYFLIRGEELEGRFGLDQEPKFWVKKAVDLADGSPKIIKLVFYESFIMQLGVQRIKCYRSPKKEARILDKTRGDPYFMRGRNMHDRVGNVVRVIERIHGTRLYDFINGLTMDHETYFHQRFPSLLNDLMECIEAIRRLHRLGEVHGDIRNDHVFIDRGTGLYRWIDFDYSYEWAENPFGVDLYGLGNLLLLAVGKGFHNLGDLTACGPPGMEVVSCLAPSDLSLFFKHRIINLRKLFPYIPDSLNQILLHFSHGAKVFYTTTDELLEDLMVCRQEMSN